MKSKNLKFPHDEQSHDADVEWWYLNGHLQDRQKRKYFFMQAFFKIKPDKANVPFLKKIPLKEVYFSHYLLSDVKNKETEILINPICFVDDQSFKKSLLWLHYDNSALIAQKSTQEYQLFNKFVDLDLKSDKKPLLVGQTGLVDLKTAATYYYCLPRLQAQGQVKVKDNWRLVQGLAWMDHQWADTRYSSEDKWRWFSLQLEGGTDIVCFEYGQQIKTCLATISYPNNRQYSTTDVIFQPIGRPYASRKTKAQYQLTWKIKLPNNGIKLEVEPLTKDNEVVFGSINYWEGGLKVKGKIDGQPVKGQGFLEIVGSPMQEKMIKIYLNQVNKLIKDQLNLLKPKI